MDIVENVEDSAREITLEEAQKNDPKNKDLKVGEKVFEELPQIDFGRIAAQSAKQVISSRVREAEKNRQYEDFIDKQGQILSGIIKRLEYGNVIIDLGKAEGVLKKDELIPREILKTGDRVKAYCYEVKKELKGHQIFLSRAHPQFLQNYFFKKFLKYMREQLKLNLLQGIQEVEQKYVCILKTHQLIQLVLVLV